MSAIPLKVVFAWLLKPLWGQNRVKKRPKSFSNIWEKSFIKNTFTRVSNSVTFMLGASVPSGNKSERPVDALAVKNYQLLTY